MQKQFSRFFSLAARLAGVIILLAGMVLPVSTAQALPINGPHTGIQPMVVIVVNFVNISTVYTPEQIRLMAFGPAPSIADYFAKASFNNLTISPATETYGTANDGLIVVNLPVNHPNNSVDTALRTLADQALDAADPSINFAAFDTNMNGKLSFKELRILFIVAGNEELYCEFYEIPGAAACPTQRILGGLLGFDFGDARPVHDGVNTALLDIDNGDFGGFLMFGERHSRGGTGIATHLATIGPIVNKIGTQLLWPDLFAGDDEAGNLPDGIITAGAGEWSLMGTGYWNGMTYAGDSPALPDPFLRWYQGWITPVNPVNGIAYQLSPSATDSDFLLIASYPIAVAWQYASNPPHPGPNEFWLIENRQKTSYDSALPGCGFLVWHIYERAPTNNKANADRARPLVALEQADNLSELEQSLNGVLYPTSILEIGDAGDPFGIANLAWGPETSPSSHFYSGLPSLPNLTFDAVPNCTSVNDLSLTYTAPPQVYDYFLPQINR